MSSVLVYVHGTNGSGKSTLARAVVVAAGGVEQVVNYGGKAITTWTKRGPALIGKYGNACGGIDGMQPYTEVGRMLRWHEKERTNAVFGESLVTPGLQTCKDFASCFDQTVFILLDTPETVCIQNVLKRRKAKGNTKEYSPDNLYTKARSARSWANNLEASGLEVHRLQYREAYALTLELLGLPSPSVEELLS